MTNNNNLIPKENFKKVEEVREINNETPSFEEFMKTYEIDKAVNYDDLNVSDISIRKGYGPCSDDDYCDCSCRWKSDCNHLINYKMYGGEGSGSNKGSLKYKLDLDGVELKDKISASIRCKKTDYDETNYFNVSAGGSIGLNSEGVNLGAKAGIDLVKYENENGFKARAGLNVDTGGTVGKDGAEVKFLGFGVSVGKKNGISTPFGEISKSSDDCVIQ